MGSMRLLAAAAAAVSMLGAMASAAPVPVKTQQGAVQGVDQGGVTSDDAAALRAVPAAKVCTWNFTCEGM